MKGIVKGVETVRKRKPIYSPMEMWISWGRGRV